MKRKPNYITWLIVALLIYAICSCSTGDIKQEGKVKAIVQRVTFNSRTAKFEFITHSSKEIKYIDPAYKVGDVISLGFYDFIVLEIPNIVNLMDSEYAFSINTKNDTIFISIRDHTGYKTDIILDSTNHLRNFVELDNQ